MGKVIFDMSMSLDGFVAGPNDSPQEPAGEGGQRLQKWFAEVDDSYADFLQRSAASCGAIVMGRRTYDFSATGGWWGDAGPLGQTPCFVLSHHPPAQIHAPHVFSFVNEGIHAALAKAQAVAGKKAIGLMGANVQQQFLNAGLVDEFHINVVPVLFGGGTRLFEKLDVAHITLEQIHAIPSPGVAHIAYRVVKPER